MTLRTLGLGLVASVMLAGCAARPATAPRAAMVDAPPRVGSLDATGAIVNRLQARAREAQSGQRWAEAVTQWEVLVLLQPEESAHLEALDAARQAAREAGAVHWKTAEAARNRRNPDAAVLAYLRVLAADPRHAGAAAALKTIEAERTGRTWLNRPPRGGYTAPGTGEEAPDRR
jgi:hypothetical protein